jgi:uncharacterized protein YjbJ (UPF0337 family)
MLSDVLKGKWKELRGRVKETWGELTDDDLDRIAGEWDQLVGALQKKYGYTKTKAETKASEFLKDFESQQPA